MLLRPTLSGYDTHFATAEQGLAARLPPGLAIQSFCCSGGPICSNNTITNRSRRREHLRAAQTFFSLRMRDGWQSGLPRCAG